MIHFNKYVILQYIMDFYKKKLEILSNPQTFKINVNVDEELAKSIYDNLKSMEAKDIILKFEDCGNPQIMNFDFETMSEDKLKKEIQKTENKIRELEEEEEE
jgi:hypothetical protein